MKKSRERKELPLFCIIGPNGAGKTEILNLLLLSNCRDILLYIPRYASRPRRPDEKNSQEYKFVTPEEFEELKRKGFFIPGTIREDKVDGVVYYKGVPKKKYWPRARKKTRFRLALFGTTSSYFLKAQMPEMRLVYIKNENRINRLRVVKRFSSSADAIDNRLTQYRNIAKHRRLYVWCACDYTVSNEEEGGQLKCAEEILKYILTTCKL